MKKAIQGSLDYLAKKVLAKYQPQVIGITGSVGKTSTKEAIKIALAKDFSVRASQKNYNTEWGVPLTILGASLPRRSVWGWLKVLGQGLKVYWQDFSYPQILILEMAADHKGDIVHLTKLAPCQIGVVTSLAPVHLEYFGSLANIKKEKQKMVEHLPKSGLAVLNRDLPEVYQMREKTKARAVTFGFQKGADVLATDIALRYNEKGDLAGLSFKLNCAGNVVPVFLPKVISYAHIYSVLAALAVGHFGYNLNILSLADNLKKFAPPPGRMRLIKGIKSTWLIDDTYNSSPASVQAALELLQDIKLKKGARKIVVLGDMLELGKFTREAHYQAGLQVVESGADFLLTKGEAAREIGHGAQKAGMAADKIFNFSHNEELGRFLQELMQKGDYVLIKGSRAMRMEKVVKEVMAYPLKAKELLVS